MFAKVAIYIFCISSLFIFYVYFGYYLLLLLFPKRKPNITTTTHHSGTSFLPPVSILISVFNEERMILAKLDNIHMQNYPQGNISTYIVSDASTDKTNEIVNSCGYESVHLLTSPLRRGKTHCENLALQKIEDDFVVFTDASTMLEPNCLLRLMAQFQCEDIGCVSTFDKSIPHNSAKGESLYVKYEMAIRRMESNVESLVGLSGSCYAARRVLCTELPDHVTRDFVLPLAAREKGYISVDEPEAICYVASTDGVLNEYRRKVRTFTNGISTLLYKSQLLNIAKHGKYALILWSHKVFRWLLPLFYLLLLFSNIVIYEKSFFLKLTLWTQMFMYAIPLWLIVDKRNSILSTFAKLSLYIHLTNIASLFAWVNILRGNSVATWNPTTRFPIR